MSIQNTEVKNALAIICQAEKNLVDFLNFLPILDNLDQYILQLEDFVNSANSMKTTSQF